MKIEQPSVLLRPVILIEVLRYFNLKSFHFINHIKNNLEILFEKVNKGTKVSIVHTNLPKDSGKYYRKGWKDHYFKPMKEYFEESK